MISVMPVPLLAAHPRECYIVLVNADEKTVKLSHSFLSLRQPFLMQPQRFFALHTELLLHFGTEISLIASDTDMTS